MRCPGFNRRYPSSFRPALTTVPFVRDTSRQDGIAVLLAVAALLAAVGGGTEKRAAWFMAAGLFLAMAVLWAGAPPSRRVGVVTVLGRWLYRRKLSPRPGWKSGNIAALAGTTLVLSCERQSQALPGFLCEIQGPSGAYHAYTDEARAVLTSTRPTERLALPVARPSAVLMFPDGFTVQDGECPSNDQLLPRGRYHVLWWCWQRREDGVSVQLEYIAGHTFRQGRAGFAHGG